MSGYMDVRIYGSMDIWMHGCFGIWMCGCVDVWMYVDDGQVLNRGEGLRPPDPTSPDNL